MALGERFRVTEDEGELFRSFSAPLIADAFLLCACVGLLALLLPHPPEVRDTAGWVLVGAVLVAAGVIRFRSDLLPASHQLMAAAAVAVVLVAVWVGGPGIGGVALAGFFNLIAAAVFAFLTVRATAVHLVIIAVGYGVLLAGQDVVGWPAAVCILVGELVGVTYVSYQMVSRLHDLAMSDELTGVDNRRAWYGRVADEIDRSTRSGEPFSVALIDLDHFKEVNDAEGHAAGDALLVEITEAWRTALRTVDCLARWGGDEFALVLPRCDRPGAAVVIRQLDDVTPVPHSFTAGVATWSPGDDADDLARRADEELYQRKQARP